MPPRVPPMGHRPRPDRGVFPESQCVIGPAWALPARVREVGRQGHGRRGAVDGNRPFSSRMSWEFAGAMTPGRG